MYEQFPISPEEYRMKAGISVRHKTDQDLIDIFNKEVSFVIRSIKFSTKHNSDYVWFNKLQTVEEYRRLKDILEDHGWFVTFGYNKESIRAYHRKPNLWTRIMG